MNQTWVNYPKPWWDFVFDVHLSSSEAPKGVAHQDLWGHVPKQQVQQTQPAGCHQKRLDQSGIRPGLKQENSS